MELCLTSVSTTTRLLGENLKPCYDNSAFHS
jgi:hypothetical protein